MCSAVLPWSFTAFTWALLLRRRRTTSVWLILAACISGVHPSESARSTVAPQFNSNCTTEACPL
ncbi:hypothetical protein PF011_g5904 [Phytophthora fragariae]|uniref:RxLR effector protein n=1 Tax=Phytophthora fragariae TaxID=53985 RepID=A0A6A3LLA9_9STRA|nr:hypothetical protein PF011_g5904 [Phytophthora fragariae]